MEPDFLVFHALSLRCIQEVSRRRRLLFCVNDLLSVIERETPVLSNDELRMKEQLSKYQCQMRHFQESLDLIV